MLTVLSPAKTLDYETPPRTRKATQPHFIERAAQLVDDARDLSPDALQKLMGISENIALLNHERFMNWQPDFNLDNAKQAVLAFKGDVYTGLDANTLDGKALTFAQKHLRILSGLYGLLRPLDLMQPYRLEMGTKLKNDSGENLYAFWGDELSKSLSLELKSHDEKFIVNCASVEYFKSVNNEALTTEIITPIFKEIKNGKVRIISIFAKKARGMMARFIIKNQINNPNDILHFNYGGYTYDKSLSSINSPVFTRQQP